MPANMLKTRDFSVGAGHAREIRRPIVAGRSGPCARAGGGGPITLPAGGHGAAGGHHGRSGFGKSSHFFRKTGKKSGMVLFFSMIPIG